MFKRTIRHLAVPVFAASIALASAAQADPVTGLWQTQPGDDGAFGHVEISPCGTALCGTLVRAFDANGSPVDSDRVGRQIVWDMTGNGDGNYGGGKIWAPDRDKIYSSKMALAGDRLTVSGCVLGLCRSQTWARVQ